MTSVPIGRRNVSRSGIDASSPVRPAPKPHPVVLKRGDRLRVHIASRTDLLWSDQSHDHAQFDMQVPP